MGSRREQEQVTPVSEHRFPRRYIYPNIFEICSAGVGMWAMLALMSAAAAKEFQMC